MGKKLFSTRGLMPKMSWQKMAGISSKDLGLPRMTPKRRKRKTLAQLLRDV